MLPSVCTTLAQPLQIGEDCRSHLGDEASFELVWNRSMIDSIQITAAEELDVGRRAGYYDHFGAVSEPTRGSKAATENGFASLER